MSGCECSFVKKCVSQKERLTIMKADLLVRYIPSFAPRPQLADDLRAKDISKQATSVSGKNASAGNRTRGWPNHLKSEDIEWQRPILPLNHQCWFMFKASSSLFVKLGIAVAEEHVERCSCGGLDASMQWVCDALGSL